MFGLPTMPKQIVELQDEQLHAYIQKKIDQIIKNEGYISYDIYNTGFNVKGNYIGCLHKVDVKGKTKDGDKESHWFIKVPRQINVVFFNTEEILNTEPYAFAELIKTYEELQDHANVPDEARFKTVKSVVGYSEAILEDLSRKGFKTCWPKTELIPLTFVELSVKQLAKFHALSMVLKYQRPDYFKRKIITSLENFLIIEAEHHETVIENMLKVPNSHLSEESKKLIVILMNEYRETWKKHLIMSKTLKCLCHGDFRRNNVWYREKDCTVNEVIISDSQTIHYGCPINDFMFFIFSETDHEFQRKHLEHLKNLYYSNIHQFLKYFEMDLNDLWPRTKFEIQFRESLHLGIFQSFFTISREDLFNAEFFAYSELFKIYEELQANAKVPNQTSFRAVKCFEGSSSKAIFLENLSSKEFKNWPRMEVVSLSFAELSINELAKFHSLSIVIQNQRPEYFNSVIKSLENFLTVESEQHDAVIKSMLNISTKHLTEESRNLIAKLMATYRDEVEKHLKKTFKCLCHGDLRKSNLIYNEQDCEVREYQMIHYGCPINDLIFFIFLETDREFRRKHLDHLKNLYFNSLEFFLRYFDINLNVLLPRDEFESQFEECLHLGLIHAIAAMPFTFTDDNEVLDLENGNMMDMNPEILDRIQGLVDDFIEWRGSKLTRPLG